MLSKLKELVISKKFLITVLGSVVVGVLSYLQVSHEIIAMVASLFGVNVAAQGVADFGKSASQPPK